MEKTDAVVEQALAEIVRNAEKKMKTKIKTKMRII